MATKTEQFLTLYKTYEGLLREHGKDYKEIEESADDMTSNRMRIMRQIRNYLSHNADPGFLTVTDVQLKTLEKMVKEEQQEGDIIKKHLLTPKRAACEEGTPLSEVLAKMGKLKYADVPVVKGTQFLGTVNLYKVLGFYLEKPRQNLNSKNYGTYGKAFVCVTPETPMSSISSGEEMIVCTSDGTVSGKFLGILKKD